MRSGDWGHDQEARNLKGTYGVLVLTGSSGFVCMDLAHTAQALCHEILHRILLDLARSAVICAGVFVATYLQLKGLGK